MVRESALVSAALADRFQRGEENCLPELVGALKAVFAGRLRAKYHRALWFVRTDGIFFDALAQGWRHRAQYDPEKGPLDAWLWTIADHRAAYLLRAGAADAPMPPEDVARVLDGRTCETHGEAVACGDEGLADLVRNGLARLKPSQQFVLMADAMSPDGVAPAEELARELGVSAEVVRQRRCRGRHALEAWLRDEGVDEEFLYRLSRPRIYTNRGEAQGGERGAILAG